MPCVHKTIVLMAVLSAERMGFEAPTHVQAQSIPFILSGRDV